MILALTPTLEDIRAGEFRLTVPAETTTPLFFPVEPRDRLEEIAITNLGPRPVHEVVIQEVSRDWSSNNRLLGTILREIKPSDERELALGIFQYVHDHLGVDPYRSNWDVFGLWRTFNCYGMGHCEVHARAVSALAQMAGLRARQVNVSLRQDKTTADHTMAEVFYDGDWHLLDSSGGTFYLERDNQTIASWDEVRGDAALLRRTRVPEYESVNMNHHLWSEEDRVTSYYSDARSRTRIEGATEPALSLRPLEKISYSRESGGTFVNNRRPPDWRPFHSNGQATLETILPGWDCGWTSIARVSGFETSASREAVLPPMGQGLLTVPIATSFPIVDATLTLRFTLEGERAELALFGEKNYYPKAPKAILGTWNSAGPGEVTLHLRETLDRWNRPYVLYAYNLILQATACEESSVRIESLFVETAGEISRRSLPDPSQVPWVLRSVGSRDTRLSVEIKTRPGPLSPPVPRIRDLDKVVATGKDVLLAWLASPVPGGGRGRQSRLSDKEGEAVTFDVEISDDPQFRWKLLPLMNLRKDLRATQWSLSRSLLPAKGVHYWRVRSRGRNDNCSEWSRVARIRYEG